MIILDYFSKIESVNKIINAKQIKVGESCDGFNLLLIAEEFYNSDKTIFVCLPTLYQAQKYYDSLASFINEDDVLFFPADELVSAEMIAATGDFLFERIQTIYTLLNNQKKIVIMNVHALIKYEMPISIWNNSILRLKKNDSYDINKLIDKLIYLGYEPVYTIVKTGQFSKRGSIVDVFPFGHLEPVRLDFFDDEIDTIKTFNTETQRSIANIDNVDIIPVTELMYTKEECEFAKNKISAYLDGFSLSQIESDMYKHDIEDLGLHKNLDSLARYITFFNDEATSIVNFFDNKRLYFIDPQKSKECYERLTLDLNEYCGRVGGYSLAGIPMFMNLKSLLNEYNVQIEGLRTIQDVDYNVYAKAIEPYKANQKAILKDFKDYISKRKLIVSIANEDRYNRLKEYLDENDIFMYKVSHLDEIKKGIVNCYFGQSPSFILENEDFMIINESDIFDIQAKPKKVKYKSIYKNAIKISKYDELCIGDYVVHYDYGIGRYLGIQTLDVGNIKRDYLYVEYAKKTAMYIPLESISNLMKYASKDVEGIELNEIGDTKWAKAKARVKNRVHDISDRLIKLYSERQAAIGFQFPEDSPEQIQFESEFQYELTPDQKKAVEAIKKDMESQRPMDRLVCGDVGYGKTEVALRAAFKAVYGGKQVCVLAPTTILARQHYHTFKDRMEKYGIRVELLSRFVSKKEQTKIIEDLNLGSVDVIIGTHRLLSKDITYKALGLLIVDEEQRFGVTHKEKIKELKVNVDCITLSATPIPRTLQMSVMGLKDLSMIETPPKNRYPIQTYVLERNDRIIQDAIERELARGGQVFYLYNYVDGIEEEEAHLHSLVPEARIAVGHGKLTKDKLENVITSFINHEYDILLCTTIIETGIDMPDTNTLIIHDADRLGLSQMYQIRGRVGRSNKIAYAYLMYEPRKLLTPQAEKRLETIKEFNELGSGFKIAMRDLSIRGSGDLLGEEQSGFVESIGIDMYLKLLDEELHHKDDNVKKSKPDPSMNKPLTNRTINQNYISNDDIRIEIHKRIDLLNNINDMNSLIDELTDRFGSVDSELRSYMLEKIMKNLFKEIGIYHIDVKLDYINLVFTKEASKNQDGNNMFQVAYKMGGIKLSYKDSEINITFDIRNLTKEKYFEKIIKYLNSIKKTTNE